VAQVLSFVVSPVSLSGTGCKPDAPVAALLSDDAGGTNPVLCRGLSCVLFQEIFPLKSTGNSLRVLPAQLGNRHGAGEICTRTTESYLAEGPGVEVVSTK